MIRLLKLTLAFMLCTVAYGATMRNSDVVRMVSAGASVTEVVNSINASDPGFTMYEEDVSALRKSGVPDIVIRAMSMRQ